MLVILGFVLVVFVVGAIAAGIMMAQRATKIGKAIDTWADKTNKS